MPQNHRSTHQGQGWEDATDRPVGITMGSLLEERASGERLGDDSGSGIQGRDFSSYNRELRDQIDPDTGERLLLLTKKQFLKLQLQQLKDFGE